MDDKQTTARLYMLRDIEEALAAIADARKLMTHANLPAEIADDLVGRLDRAEGALEYARKDFPDA